jgi:hypothetical protein
VKNSRRLKIALVILASLHTPATHPAVAEQQVNLCSPWPATDGLGRALPSGSQTGKPRPDRFVGIFYFLWHNQREGSSPNWDGPFDVTRILGRDPDALRKPDSPLWGPIGMFHYWGEPLYGYYLSTDPWVLRRHANLLADAGIDTLIFDTTNAVTYPEVYNKLCEVFEQIRGEGNRTPQIAFMVNTEAGKTAQKIHNELYKPGHHPDLWFRWQGKPLMICDPQAAGPELREFFTLRKAHWPFQMINTPFAWHWEAAYPQPYGFTDDPGKPEQVNVSVAQNLRASDAQVTNMSNLDARGRSFHDGKQNIEPGSVDRGFNVEEQWKRAYALQAPFLMVTGWNEWIAGRWGEPGKPPVFVDQFSQEFSRDIEPMKGGHVDNYYLQLIGHVRRYKGAPALPKLAGPKTIRIEGPFDQWRDVQPEFHDHLGETSPRDFNGAGGTHYTNRTGRNDFAAFKVTFDDMNVYFHARTREAVSAPSGRNWMWLLLDADGDARTGWEGYDFIANRQVGNDGISSLERNEGGWKWKRTASLAYRLAARELHLAISLASLELKAESVANVRFKWVDNIQVPGEIMDFYVSGDVAPEGRMSYAFDAEPAALKER